MKKNHKRIFLLLIALAVMVVANFTLNSVEAAITTSSGGTSTSFTVTESFWNGLSEVIRLIGTASLSGIGAFITPLINLLSMLMFLLLEMIFKIGSGSFASPLPDSIAFNKAPILDANFINPHQGSLISEMGADIFGNLFATFQTIAIAIFVIAAMVTGLKLALSSIASKKAQYKEAALKWLTGFLVLLCLRWILAGVFYINETVVATISKSASSVEIPVKILSAIPVIGRILSDIWSSIASLWGGDGAISMYGYYGIIVANLMNAIGGDIIASIVTFVILGQSFTFIGTYVKRLFMCVLLGMISPLIVAADTIVSATGGRSTILKTWIKNFTLTVFIQTIHAMSMLVILSILSNIYHSRGNYLLQSIVTIVLTTGLVKMEKLVKGMFGIGDSLAGDLKDGGKGMIKAMAAMRGVGAAAMSLKDNVPKMQQADKKRQAYRSELTKLKDEQAHGTSSAEKAKTAFAAAKEAKANGNMDEYNKQKKIAAEHLKEAREYGYTLDKRGNNVVEYSGNANRNTANNVNTNNSNSNNNTNNNNNGDYLQQIINKNTSGNNLTREERIQKLEEGIANETSNYKSAKLAKTMGVANLAAGIGLGLGMGDDVSETLFKGGMITAALDKGTEMVGRKAADKDRKTFYEQETQDGRTSGYTPSEKIIREKTTVEAAVTLDVAKLNNELKKQFKDLGEVFGDQIKKELRHIDQDLDNE